MGGRERVGGRRGKKGREEEERERKRERLYRMAVVLFPSEQRPQLLIHPDASISEFPTTFHSGCSTWSSGLH